jgi:hypothetical protein
MDILIKSFNRPYYLERCLKSIFMYVKGDYNIIILDDGTPPEYLDQILANYPQVRIARSVLYNQKVKALQDHFNGIRPYPRFPIPSDSLVQVVSGCTEEFVLMEDDIWFVAPIYLEEIQEQMQINNIALVKIFWQGNQKFINGEKKLLSPHIEELVPSIPFLSKVIFMNRFKADKILPILYKTKISSVLYRLGLLKDESEMRWPFYTMFSMAAAVYNKQYFMHILSGAPSVLDEPYQLKRAVEWVEQHKSRFAKTTEQLTDTSYICSTYNGFEGIHLDLIRFNHYLNQAWLRDELDVIENFPKDFRPEYIKRFMDREEDETCQYSEWLKWIQRFKGQYRSIGCVVE